MDLFFTPAAYAEDQANSKLILGVHVIHRGFNQGSFLGIGTSLATTTIRKMRKPGYHFCSLSNLIRFASRGGLFGVGLGTIMLGGKMYNKDLIEWQDRSWRILDHFTQNQTDHWILTGATIGMVIQGLYRSRNPRALVGGAAMGSSAGIVVMLAYRAINGEKVKPSIEPVST